MSENTIPEKGTFSNPVREHVCTRKYLRSDLIIVSRKAMEQICNTPKTKYDAKKAAKEAKKELRKQGLKL